ncbi:MAG: ABC transporter permease [Lachnospiraceae bacterium]|jgi:ABC-type transport system involved in multi-copper enzyme maturation permease subunit|nr:ABC transporter permease [Lachnospiraceae bacterium]
MELGRLELKKIKPSVYRTAAAGIFVGLLALGILFLFIEKLVIWDGGDVGDLELFASWDGLLALMTALNFCVFSIFSAVMGAKLVIGEYGEKMAVILLGYPIPRTRILRVKCLLFGGVTVLAAFVENVLVMGLMCGVGYVFEVEPEKFTGRFFPELLAASFFAGLLACSVGMISVTVGWKKRSPVAAIVCALLMLCLSANLVARSYGILLPAMAGLGVFLTAAGLAAYRVLKVDIERLEV